MTVEINNPGVGTQAAEPAVADAPLDLGQAEVTDGQALEQAEIGTDNQGVYSPDNYKKLQAEFTRKSQEFSEFQKRTSKDAEELAAFRQMYSNQQTQTPIQKPQDTSGREISAKEFANLEPMEQLDYLIDRRVGKIVTPLQEENAALKQQLNYLVNEAANRSWNEFVATHPDAVGMEAQIADAINKYRMPLDKAYKLLKADMAVPEAKQEILKEMEAKKDATKIMKPVSTPTTPANTKVSSFDEAWEKTKKELGMK